MRPLTFPTKHTPERGCGSIIIRATAAKTPSATQDVTDASKSTAESTGEYRYKPDKCELRGTGKEEKAHHSKGLRLYIDYHFVVTLLMSLSSMNHFNKSFTLIQYLMKITG